MIRYCLAITLYLFVAAAAVVGQSVGPRSDTKSGSKNGVTSAETVRERAIVRFDGVPAEYAEAMANICDSVSRFLQQEFNLDVPDRVTLAADLKKDNRTAISNNGLNEIRLTLERAAQLKSPPSSRVLNVYGICSEMADLALRKTLTKPEWMTDDAWQGLRYYLASESMDQLNLLYARKLWPDGHDYSAEGVTLFRSRVRGGHGGGFVRAAGDWQELSNNYGRATVGSLLREFRKADAEKREPASAMKALQPGGRSRTRSKLQRWYSNFEPRLVQRAKGNSGGKSTRSRQVSLTGAPITLKNDDGRGELQFITEDAAPAALFEVEYGEWRLTRVAIFAAMESTSRVSGDAAKVWLCDRDMKPIQSWSLPARSISTGGDWVKLKLDQPAVSGQFVICVEPVVQDGTTLKVGVDDSSKGRSAIGKVGGAFKPFAAGQWMIRVEADTDRTTNPLLWRP